MVLGVGSVQGGARPQTLLPAPVPRAMYSILGLWLARHREDFVQPPEFPCLSLVLAYVRVHFAGSSLERQVQLLLSELKDLPPPEADVEGEDGEGGKGAREGVGRGRAPLGRSPGLDQPRTPTRLPPPSPGTAIGTPSRGGCLRCGSSDGEEDPFLLEARQRDGC